MMIPNALARAHPHQLLSAKRPSCPGTVQRQARRTRPGHFKPMAQQNGGRDDAGASASEAFLGAKAGGVAGGGQQEAMGDAAYVLQLNSCVEFLRQNGFHQAEKQLLSELEQKFPSLGMPSSSEEENASRQAPQDVATAAPFSVAAAAAGGQATSGSQQQQQQQQQGDVPAGSVPPFPPRQPPQMRKPPHRILKQIVPWGPDVDEYQNVEDVGYVRKDISGQQQFVELELAASDIASEGNASVTGASELVSSHVGDEEDEEFGEDDKSQSGSTSSSSMNEEGDEEEEEEEEGSVPSGSGAGGDVASLSETEELGVIHPQRRTSSFQSPASDTLDLLPTAAAAAAASPLGLGLGESSDPTWDMGPQDIKLTEPVSTPSKGSGDQQQQGEEPRPVLSRVESLSSSLKDFDAERIHEAMEGMTSGRVSRAQSDTEHHPPQQAELQGAVEVIDFNPIPLAEATPQDLKAIGLQVQQTGATSDANPREASSSLAVAVGSKVVSPLSAGSNPEKAAGAAASSSSHGPTTPGREEGSQEAQQQQQQQPDLSREAGGGFSFPVTPKQSDEPQSHPPPFKSWPSVRSSFTSEFAAASDDDHNAADYADEEYSKSLSASKSASRSTSQNLSAHLRKLDIHSHADEDAGTGGSTGPDQWKLPSSKLGQQQQQQAECRASDAEGPHSGPTPSSSGASYVGPTFFGGTMTLNGASQGSTGAAAPSPTGSRPAGEGGGKKGESSSSQGPASAVAAATAEAGGGCAGSLERDTVCSQKDLAESHAAAAAQAGAELSWFQGAAGGGGRPDSPSGIIGNAVPSRSPIMVMATSTSGESDGSHEGSYGSPMAASESVQSASQLTLAPSPYDDGLEGPAAPDVVAHMVDHSNASSTSSMRAAEWDGDGGDAGTSSVQRRQVPRTGTYGMESGADDTEMREAEANVEAQELQWQQVQLGAQQEAASHNTPPYTTDENGMLMYQYDQDYVAKNYEVFDLRVYHRRCHTGFEETKDFPIRMNDLIAGRYQVMDFLGSAAFSRAIQALDVKTGMLVCLKIIKNNKDYFDQSLDEIKLLKFTNSYDPEDKHNIVRLYDFFYYKEHLFLVCELLRANLYEFQKYNRESGDAPYFTNACIQRIARQVLGSLEFLHSLGLIHSDLKPENILIKSYSRCEVKVIDLGSSCFTTDQLSSYVQSRSYRAPEVILGLPYNQKVDVWSLGCILAELSSGQVLFQNDSLATLLARLEGILGPVPEWMVQKGRYASRFYTRSGQLYERNPTTDRYEMLIPKRTTLSHRVPDAHKGLVDFISYLLLVDPHKRPSAAEALQHPFMAEDYYS